MKKIEPYATQQEFKKRVVNYKEIPLVDLVPGVKSHIVPANRATISFIIMEPNSHFALHKHKSEQIMTVIDGAIDEIVDGKIYHLEKDDVIILPSNIEHGGYISERGCSAIDIFCPPRQDYVDKLKS